MLSEGYTDRPIQPPVGPLHRRGRLLAALLLVGLAAGAPSRPHTVAVELSLGDLAGEGWRLEDVNASLAVDSDGRGTVAVTAARLTFADEPRPFEGLRLACHELRSGGGGWHCSRGELAVGASPVGPLGPAAWQGRLGSGGDVEITVSGLAMAGGELAARASRNGAGWSLAVTARRLGSAHLWPALPGTADLPLLDLQGVVDADLRLEAEVNRPLRAVVALDAAGIGFASRDGRHAAEGLHLTAHLEARHEDGLWRGDARLGGRAGQFYVEPAFLDFDQWPLEAACSGSWSAAQGRLECTRWTLDQGDTLQASGSLDVGLQPLAFERLSARLRSARLGALYRIWAQPLLIGSVLDDLELTGSGDLDLTVAGGRPARIELSLKDLQAREQGGLFALQGVTGEVHWRREAPAETSRLSFAGGSLYGVGFGPFEALFHAVGERLALDEELTIPVLDGTVVLDGFALQGFGGPTEWRASAVIEELALTELTETLDWPRFSGVVTGRLPDVQYADGVLQAGDGLQLRAFDGQVSLNDVRIQDPFGVAPRLTGGARLRGLDLAALTRTFSFGRIEGRLDGDLRDLELVAWQPNRFQLQLYTPSDAKGRQLISQRAVENLTELGSGVPAGLSATLLRVFDEFRYDRIEIRVDLEGNVARLSGIPRADGGYYLVRGGGLPRIDVIGRNRQVAWKDLVERLRNIRLEGARVE